MTARRPGVRTSAGEGPYTRKALCPRCGTFLHYNDVGAWCPGYPCRYTVNREKARAAARIATLLWGRSR